MLFEKTQLSPKGIQCSLKQGLLVLLIAGLSACGGGSSKSGPDPEPQVVGVVEGVALGGNGSATAVDNTVNRSPRAVPAEYVQDGLLTTRLVAVLNPAATVDEVNQALSDYEASIVTMIEGQPFVTLAIEPVADQAEAQSRAQALKDSGAFVYVRPGRQAPLATNSARARSANASGLGTSLASRNAARQSAEGYVDHVLSSRFPAAWNLSRAASHDASLVVPNVYAEHEAIGQYNELPLLYLLGSGTRINPNDPVIGSAGNLGYQHLGIAAGENLVDGSQSRKLGADPVAIQHLDAYGFYAYGLDETDLLADMYFNWPANGNTVVLMDNTYTDPDQLYYRYLDRAWSGLMWRHFAHDIEATHGPLLMITPSGHLNGSTPDDVNFNSAFAVATLENIQAMVYLSEDTSSEEQQAFLDFYNQLASIEPSSVVPLENVLLVGSSDADGNESSFSWPGAQLRAVGENVVGPCLVASACDSNTQTVTTSSTMAAAAQVAGLASYLWHIDNQLTPADLLLRLQHAYSSSDIPGVIDAWTAVLSLDTSLADAKLRKTLLDVSGAGGQPDGVFNETDVNAFLNAFDAFDGSTAPDWSVYDLNGDGWTNGSGTARMDLDVNNLPSFGTVNQNVDGEDMEFDETGVTDTEVLCYYLFSPLFTGNTDNLDIVPGCQGGSKVAILGSEVHVTGEVGVSDGIDADGSENDLPYYNQSEINSGISAMSANCCSIPGHTGTTSLSTTATLNDTLDPQDTYLQSTQIQFTGQVSASMSTDGQNHVDVGFSASAIGEVQAIYGLEVTQSSQMTLLGYASNECYQSYVQLYEGSFDENSNFAYGDQLFLYAVNSSLNQSFALEPGQYRLSAYMQARAAVGFSGFSGDPQSESESSACDGRLTIRYQ